jgi:hypothetical protein
MFPSTATLALSNPFCAARLRPGTIDFVFEAGRSVAQLVEVLESHGWRGQITGGHGTGKSTLLVSLVQAMQGRGCRTILLTLAAGQHALPRNFAAALRGTDVHNVAVIDGFEQLYPWSRLRIRWLCRMRGLGLVVASHRTSGLPDLYTTAVDPSRAWIVVQRLQDGYLPRIQPADLADSLGRHSGNLREALFEQYDLYEARAREPKQR